jgi:tape measure domain-containing protein
MANEELSVKITGDATSLTKAAADASRSLEDLSKDVSKVDAETIEITPEMELSRINRDSANLKKVLARFELAKVQPDASLDMTQLLRDEARVRKELDNLDRRKVEVEAEVNVNTTGLDRLQATVDGLSSSVGGAVPGLSRLSSGLGTFKGAAGGAGVAAGGLLVAVGGWKAAFDLGGMAADVQTTQLQLKALTGSATEASQVFDDLQKFAATTPFEFAGISDAAKALLIAGVQTQDLTKWLTDLGNTSAATGVPLQDIAVIFQQMRSKGKVSNEELLQLAERGVDAYGVLSRQLGISVADVQKLASESKLSVDAVDGLAAGLGDLYPTAMQDQAETFNGQMSTLHDTFTQTEQTLGQLFLPTITRMVQGFNVLAGEVLGLTGKLIDFNDWVTKVSVGGGNLFETLNPLAGGVHLISKAFGDSSDSADDAADSTSALGVTQQDTTGWITDTTDAAAEQAKTLDDLTQRASDATSRFHDLRDAFSTVNDEMVSSRGTVYDYQGALDDLATSLDKGDTFAPDAEQGRANWDALVALGETASGRVLDALHTGGRKAAEQMHQSTRKAMHQMLVDAGVDSDRAWHLVDQVLIKPHAMKVELDRVSVARLRARLLNLRKERLNIKAQVTPADGTTSATAAEETMRRLKAKLRPVDAQIKAVAGQLAESRKALDNVAKPGGKGREAPIQPKVDAASLSSARSTLDLLTMTETKTIKVHMEENPTGDTLNPETVGRMLSGSQTQRVTVDAPSSNTTKDTSTTQLAPRQVPVKVYLDGSEIADHLTLKANRLATSALARRP